MPFSPAVAARAWWSGLGFPGEGDGHGGTGSAVVVAELPDELVGAGGVGGGGPAADTAGVAGGGGRERGDGLAGQGHAGAVVVVGRPHEVAAVGAGTAALVELEGQIAAQ